MTPPLTTAIAELEAALRHAQDGAAFYTQQAAQIAQALDALRLVAQQPGAPARPATKRTAKAKPTVKAKAAPKTKPAAKAKPKAPAANGSAATLPTISRDYWIALATRQPGPRAQLLATALAEHQIAPDSADAQLLTQRLGFQLTSLTRQKLLARDAQGVYHAPAAA